MSLTSPDVLTDPEYTIPPVPLAVPGGVAWLRGQVARFSSGAAHERRRALVVAELAAVDPDGLRQRAAQWASARSSAPTSVRASEPTSERASDHAEGGPVEVLAEALGLPADRVAEIAADVALVAASYQPHTAVTAAADQAVARLIEVFGGAADEVTANRIGLLVQACDSTRSLVANLLAGRDEPAVPVTRRVAPDGTLVAVDLADAPFGLGPHACPGSAHALAIAAGLTRARTS